MNNSYIKISLSAIVASTLIGCGSSDNDSFTATTERTICGPEHVVSYAPNILSVNYKTAALGADFTDGSHIDLIEDGAITDANLLADAQTDYEVFSRDGYYYRLGRLGVDNIQKYLPNAPEENLYITENGQGYSTRDAGDNESPNAKNIGFINDETAIITMHNTNYAWVVDLTAQTADDFKICELDLSAYQVNNEADGVTTKSSPKMSEVVVSENYAAIIMERLDANFGIKEGVPSMVAIFDLTTWEEVDTAPNSDGLFGIELTLNNPLDSSISGDLIYLAALDYSDNSGGIERVDLSDFSTEILTSETGFFQVASSSNGNLYGATYEGWGNNTLVEIESGNISTVDNRANLPIGILKMRNEELWVGLKAVFEPASEPTLLRIDTDTNTSIGSTIAVSRDTSSIAFIEQ